MRIQAKTDFVIDGRLIRAGELVEVRDEAGANVIEKGWAETEKAPEKEKAPAKKKATKKK